MLVGTSARGVALSTRGVAQQPLSLGVASHRGAGRLAALLRRGGVLKPNGLRQLPEVPGVPVDLRLDLAHVDLTHVGSSLVFRQYSPPGDCRAGTPPGASAPAEPAQRHE